MHDSAEARISVSLIYRYFANKEAVISAMAERHKNETTICSSGRQASSLFESLGEHFSPYIAARIAEGSLSVRGMIYAKPRGTRLSPTWYATS
jgi:hypothetical protein